jgi:hypothetical protein
MQIPIANYKTIWWSICGCSKETPPSFIFCLLFIWISNYVSFVCMNYVLNNLYGSSGDISSRLDAAVGMPYFKIACRFGLLGRAGEPPLPHTENGAGATHTAQKLPPPDVVWGGASEDALSFKRLRVSAIRFFYS